MAVNPQAKTFTKDAASTLDYTFDWTAWLASGETITSQTIAADTGITAASPSVSGGAVTTFVSGGVSGTTYGMRCQITTSDSRTDVRSMNIEVITQ